jgi:hypothetical protein
MGEKAPTTDEATSEYVKTGPMPVEQQTGKRHVGKEFYDPPPLSAAIFTYMTYAVLTLVGYVRDFLRFLGVVNNKACQEAVGSMEVRRACTTYFPSLIRTCLVPCVCSRICSN